VERPRLHAASFAHVSRPIALPDTITYPRAGDKAVDRFSIDAASDADDGDVSAHHVADRAATDHVSAPVGRRPTP
jgi:hypothetical protein